MPVLLFCDNLVAHLDEEVKNVLAGVGIFLYCLPPNLTETLQPIDAGYGRSVRLAIGSLLDEWLMEEENLAKWEGSMSAAERRVLTTHLVAQATKETMTKDNMRVECFERTGCLIQMENTAEADKLITPQGITSVVVVVPDTVGDEDDANVQNESQSPEESLRAASDEIYGESSDITNNDVVVEDAVENDDLAAEVLGQNRILIDDGEHQVEDDTCNE